MLQSNMQPIWAEEVLRDRGGSLTAQSLYDLTLLATGDEDYAGTVAARRVLEEERRRNQR